MQSNFNTKIIELIENEPRISHRVIAEQTQNQEESISRLIRDNLTDLEDFGHLGFEIRTVKNSVGAINEQKIYFLNEQQTTLLMSYLRNNPIVKNFKKLLVKEFFRMRELLQNQKSQTQTSQLPKLTNETEQIIELDNNFTATEKLIANLQNMNPATLYRLDQFYREFHNFSPLQTFDIDLNSQFFLPTELGKMINKSAVEINLILEHKGFQVRENGVWQITESGRDFGILIVGKYNQIKWKLKTIL